MNDLRIPSPQPDTRQEWLALFRDICLDIARTPGPSLDDFEKRAIAETLLPLADRIVSGRLLATSPEVYRFRFSIRNSKFRPTYDDLKEFLLKSLGIEEVPGHVADARRVVTPPSLLQIGGSEKSKTARDRAKELIRALNAKTGRNQHSHGPETWTGEGQDPLSKVPRELHEDLIADAISELNRTGKGRHPNHIRIVAARIYNDAQREPVIEPEYTDEQKAEFAERQRLMDEREEKGVPAYMLGFGNEWGKP